MGEGIKAAVIVSVARSYTPELFSLHELLLVSVLHLVELQILILQLELRSTLISLSSPTESHIDPIQKRSRSPRPPPPKNCQMGSSLLTQPTVAPTLYLDFYMRNKLRFCSSSYYLTSETNQQKFLLARKEAEESGGKCWKLSRIPRELHVVGESSPSPPCLCA